MNGLSINTAIQLFSIFFVVAFVEPQSFCSGLILSHEGSVLFPNLMGLQILWQKRIISEHAGGGGMKSAGKS